MWLGGSVTHLEEHPTGMPLTQVWFPGVARDFFPRVNFQCRLSYGVHTPHVQLHSLTSVRKLKIVSPCQSSVDYGNAKHPACTIECVAQLRSSLLSPWKATQISHGKIPLGQYGYCSCEGMWLGGWHLGKKILFHFFCSVFGKTHSDRKASQCVKQKEGG